MKTRKTSSKVLEPIEIIEQQKFHLDWHPHIKQEKNRQTMVHSVRTQTAVKKTFVFSRTNIRW
jgi:hypothetical protein